MNFLTTSISKCSELFVAEPLAFKEAQPTVYLDTSIVSYLTAGLSRDIFKARMQQITREWWNDHRSRYELCISSRVKDEAAYGDSEEARKRLEVLTPIRLLTESDESLQMADRLMGRKLLPHKARADANIFRLLPCIPYEFCSRGTPSILLTTGLREASHECASHSGTGARKFARPKSS